MAEKGHSAVMTLPSPTTFRHPAVRHLAWICRATQLYVGPQSFSPAEHIGAHVLRKLQQWDRDPSAGPPVLTDEPNRRLGIYFERLYACVLTELLGRDLLASNLPVRGSGTTLGELDFLLRNPATGELEHHEIAVKFYLGFREDELSPVRWYGPNARDRLDLKTRRLLEHQSVLGQRAETKDVLAARGVFDLPRARIFMPGYLFYPLQGSLPAPAQAAPDHARGHWLYSSEAEVLDTSRWVHLRKADWLGPYIQERAPDPEVAKEALQGVEASGRARLFARLSRDPASGFWIEQARFFVVPSVWPGRSRQGGQGLPASG